MEFPYYTVNAHTWAVIAGCKSILDAERIMRVYHLNSGHFMVVSAEELRKHYER
jgi:hypothetical protein